MQLGMIGLGRMGSYMVQRLLKAGHQCVVCDTHPQAMQDLVAKGAKSSKSLQDFASQLTAPRAIWLMIPAGAVDSILASLVPVLGKGDIVIDGGNSYYHDDIRRAAELKPKGIHYVDCGTSGGVWGLDRGYCLMIGGEEDVVNHLDPIFKSLAPGVDSA
ncbi:MAG: NAD(P)-binding domain-containing protein, partial [Acidobacteriaceae bacterium]